MTAGQAAGAVALLLYGARSLATALRRASGARPGGWLARLERRPAAAFAAGAAATLLLQSSSATTLLIVGLAAGRLLGLETAAAAVMGANVGTTVTAHLTAVPAASLGGWLLAAGVLLDLVAARRAGAVTAAAGVLRGFGLVLWSLSLLEQAAAPLAADPRVAARLRGFAGRPLAGLAAGFLLTSALDSSSATVALLQRLVRAGSLSLPEALPPLLGSNMGTTTATFAAALVLGARARQAAFTHVLFNLAGIVAGWSLLPALSEAAGATAADPGRQLANAHLLFNACNAAWQLPLSRWHARIARLLFPGRH